MARGGVYYNGQLAGFLEKDPDGVYSFRYLESYLGDGGTPPVSLTLPKRPEAFQSPVLFPFFYGLLAEGVNKEIQCRLLKIDEDDDFTRLLRTAGTDTIGAITVKELNED